MRTKIAIEHSEIHSQERGLHQFLSASEGEIDRWRTLQRLARKPATVPPDADSYRAACRDAIDELSPLEQCNGHPALGLFR